jgi:hypothetical protein
VNLADVRPLEMTWFWPNRIPAGMLSLLVGDPGASKSFLSLYMAAKATTGGLWPDGTPVGEACNVLLFAGEDDPARTIVPRLQANGANLSRIALFNASGSDAFDMDRDLPRLESRLREDPDCRLVIIDPITGYMGDANQNSHAEVRRPLMRVRDVAERTGVTILGLSHLNKKVDIGMAHRTIGSVAFTAVPRAVWGVAADRENGRMGCAHAEQAPDSCLQTPASNNQSQAPDSRRLTPSHHSPYPPHDSRNAPMPIKRYFFPLKDNLCIEPDAMEYRIVGGSLEFIGRRSARDVEDQLTQKHTGGRVSAEKDAVAEWLTERIGKDSVPSADIIKEAEEKGFSRTTLQRTANEIGIVKRRSVALNNRYVWEINPDKE